jgi:peptidase E
MSRQHRVIAVGGGTFSTPSNHSLIDDFVMDSCGIERPSICFIPTASGDSDTEIDAFYAAFEGLADCTHVQLFRRGRRDISRQIADADLVYVGGGNPANLLAIWRLHEVDEMVEAAHRGGAMIVGVSAGASCLFDGYLTDSFGPPLRRRTDGLGLVGGTFCPHYASPKRRTHYRAAVADGFGDGYGVDSNVALHFIDGELVDVVSARDGAEAYRVVQLNTTAHERALPIRVLEAD